MKKLGVGERARVILQCSRYFGKEVTIWDVRKGGWNPARSLPGTPSSPDAMRYAVNIDGVGIRAEDGVLLCYEAHHLEPLLSPGDEAWAREMVKKLVYVEPVVTTKERIEQ